MGTSSAPGQSTGFTAQAASVAGSLGKFAVILALATTVTTLLFKFNTILVSRPANYDSAYVGAKVVEFVRVEQDDYMRTKERRQLSLGRRSRSGTQGRKSQASAGALISAS